MPTAERIAIEREQDAIFVRINGDVHINYRDSFKLRYYPSVIGFYANSNGKNHELYSDSRGSDNFNRFITKLGKN
jgi:hypothetical protein